MAANETEAEVLSDEAALHLMASVAVTVISAIGLLLNGYILLVIVITKQVIILLCHWNFLIACQCTIRALAVTLLMVGIARTVKENKEVFQDSR